MLSLVNCKFEPTGYSVVIPPDVKNAVYNKIENKQNIEGEKTICAVEKYSAFQYPDNKFLVFVDYRGSSTCDVVFLSETHPFIVRRENGEWRVDPASATVQRMQNINLNNTDYCKDEDGTRTNYKTMLTYCWGKK
jgi:hypothetical protein